MSRRSWILLGTLSALWGASYLFMNVPMCPLDLGALTIQPRASRCVYTG